MCPKNKLIKKPQNTNNLHKQVSPFQVSLTQSLLHSVYNRVDEMLSGWSEVCSYIVSYIYNTYLLFEFSFCFDMCLFDLKGYLRYKTITSQNALPEAQIKNFFIS